jgi:hypothetical protein
VICHARGLQLQPEKRQRREEMTAVDVTELDTFEAPAEQADVGFVRGVRLLGLRSVNRRNYDTPGVRKTAVEHLTNARIYIDHPAQPADPRSYRDAFGVVESCRYVAGRGYYGDIRYNPEHPLAKQFTWDVKNNPTGLGMSVNARVKYGPKKSASGDDDVESIDLIRSLDVVTRPATSAGIFEHETEEAEESAMDLKTLKEKHADLIEAIQAEALATVKKSAADLDAEKTVKELQKSLAEATEQLAEIKKAEEARKLRDAIEAEFSPLVEDAELRKSVVECACELGEDSRKKFKGVVQKLAEPVREESDEDDDEDPEDLDVDADEQAAERDTKPAKPKYVPRRNAGADSGRGGRSLADILNLKKG